MSMNASSILVEHIRRLSGDVNVYLGLLCRGLFPRLDRFSACMDTCPPSTAKTMMGLGIEMAAHCLISCDMKMGDLPLDVLSP